MSIVTNAILTFGHTNNDQAILDDVNHWLTTEGVREGMRIFYEGVEPNPAGLAGGFVSIDDSKLPKYWYSSDRIFECFIALNAFNYLDLGGLVKFLKEYDWKATGLFGSAQLIVRDQDDYKFRIIDIVEVFNTEETPASRKDYHERN